MLPRRFKTATPEYGKVVMCFPNHEQFLMFSTLLGAKWKWYSLYGVYWTMCTLDTLLSSIITVSLRTSHQKNLESHENINDKINHVYQILILFSALHTYSVSFNAENNTLRRGPSTSPILQRRKQAQRCGPRSQDEDPGFKARRCGPTDHALIHQLLWV